MFGIKFPKGALSDASLSDKLMALGSALEGDMEGVASIRDRYERQKLASMLVQELNAARNTGPILTPEPIPTPTPAPPANPIGETASAVAARLSEAGGLMPAPKLDAPRLDPAAVSLPTYGAVEGPKGSLYDRMLPRLIEAAGKGMDVNGLASLARAEDYVRGLPQKDQAAARLDPGRFSGWQREDNKTITHEMGPDSVLVRQQGANGTPTELYRAPSRELPMTTDRVIGAVVAKKARGEALTPNEQAIFERWQAGSDGFYRERAPEKERQLTPRQRIEEKVASGEPLTAGEQKLWAAIQRDPYGGLLNGASGYGDEETPPPPPLPPKTKPQPKVQPQPRPAAAPADLPRKPKTAPRQTPQQSGAPPANALAQIREGGQVTFANGQIWAKRGGKAVFVGMAK